MTSIIFSTWLLQNQMKHSFAVWEMDFNFPICIIMSIKLMIQMLCDNIHKWHGKYKWYYWIIIYFEPNFAHTSGRFQFKCRITLTFYILNCYCACNANKAVPCDCKQSDSLCLLRIRSVPNTFGAVSFNFRAFTPKHTQSSTGHTNELHPKVQVLVAQSGHAAWAIDRNWPQNKRF